jgi:hypothetical protein
VDALFWGTEVAKRDSHQTHAFHSFGPKMMFASVLEHFGNLWNVKRCKTYVSRMNALFWSNEVAKMVSHQLDQLYCLGPKMFFGSVLEHFVNFLHVKRNKTCVSGINALFRGTEVAKIASHQMYPF